MILAGTAATGMPLAILAYTPGRLLALQSLVDADDTLPFYFIFIFIDSI